MSLKEEQYGAAPELSREGIVWVFNCQDIGVGTLDILFKSLDLDLTDPTSPSPRASPDTVLMNTLRCLFKVFQQYN